MKYSVHFFIGQEFSEIVSETGKFALKSGNAEAYKYINNYLVEPSKDGNIDITPFQNKETDLDWGTKVALKNTQEELSSFYSEKIFEKILTVSNIGRQAFLHVFLHFPLYKPEAFETVKILYNSIEISSRPTIINFVGYGDDLSRIIEPELKVVSSASKQMAEFTKFKKEKKMGLDKHFIIFQNASQNGIPLGLSIESLIEVVGRFTLLCTEYYDKMFPNTSDYRDIFAFGFSTLCLDKYLFVEYLLGKTLLLSMDLAEVNKSDVDVNTACDEANKLLYDKTTVLSDYFKKIDSNNNNNFPEVQKSIENDINEIIERCRNLLLADKGITTKAAIIAAILGSDCDLFSRSLFDKNSIIFDDLYNETINHFIENDTDFYKIDDKEPVNPIYKLKEIRQKMINSSADIRDSEEKLKILEKQISDTQKVEECYIEDGFYHFHDKKFRLLPQLIEEPLEDTYVAHKVTIPSIDLREKFNSIKNQGQQGSCLAFSITSIFEYILKLNQAKEYDLSEAFLYYNSRALDNTGDISVDTDLGSRFKPAMLSLQQLGIALEKFCQYDDSIHNLKPSEDAYQDALCRRLTKAQNVNINVEDIKSALSDGFPVAISVNLYPSFHTNNGYIPMPSQKEIDEQNSGDAKKEKHSRHAMVITGYSDELKMFVVRNSWGIEWGDKGYCYIPYSYIGDDKLCNYCCIISEVESYIAKMEHIPALKVDETDLYIRYFITKNRLEKEIVEYENLKNEFKTLCLYFEKLKDLFKDSNDRDMFIEKSEKRLKNELDDLKKTYSEQENKNIEELQIFDKITKKIVIKYALVGIGISLIFVLCDIIGKTIISLTSSPVNYRLLLIILGVIAGFVWFKTNKRWKERREIKDANDDILENMRKKINAKVKELDNFKIKIFCAWTILRSLCETHTYHQSLYNKFISLINNLRVSYEEIAKSDLEMSLDSPYPNVSLLDKDILDDYFNNNLKDNPVCEIDFCDSIENHEITGEYLKEYKEELNNKLRSILFNLPELANFNISAHIVENKFSNIAKQVDHEIVECFDNQSVLFLHVNSTERVIRLSKNIFAPEINIYESKLRKGYNRLSTGVSFINSDDKYILILLKTATLSVNECVMLINK